MHIIGRWSLYVPRTCKDTQYVQRKYVASARKDMYQRVACTYQELVRILRDYIQTRGLMPQASHIKVLCTRLTSVLSRSISSLSFLSGLCAALCLYMSNRLRSFLQGYTDIPKYVQCVRLSTQACVCGGGEVNMANT